MPELPGDEGDADASGDQQRGVGVAEVVEAEAGFVGLVEAGCLDGGVEAAGADDVGVQRAGAVAGEQEVARLGVD